jgi:hypothetical protein
VDRIRQRGLCDGYGSVGRYAASWRAAAERVPHLRAQQVQLTISGRAAFNTHDAARV